MDGSAWLLPLPWLRPHATPEDRIRSLCHTIGTGLPAPVTHAAQARSYSRRMRERGQSTVEYAGICLIAALLLLGAAQLAEARLRPSTPAGDAGWLALARRYAPTFVPERGDGEQPVDFRRCRAPACARDARPVLYVHAVRQRGATYLEYWE